MLFAALLPAPAHARVDADDRALDVINETRRDHGLRPYAESPSLDGSAQRYAHRLMATDTFGHAARIQASGRFKSLGEALAMHYGGHKRPRWAIRTWLNSPPHRALVLSRGYRYAGIGAVSGNFGGNRSTIWVLQLGSR